MYPDQATKLIKEKFMEQPGPITNDHVAPTLLEERLPSYTNSLVPTVILYARVIFSRHFPQGNAVTHALAKICFVALGMGDDKEALKILEVLNDLMVDNSDKFNYVEKKDFKFHMTEWLGMLDDFLKVLV